MANAPAPETSINPAEPRDANAEDPDKQEE